MQEPIKPRKARDLEGKRVLGSQRTNTQSGPNHGANQRTLESVANHGENQGTLDRAAIPNLLAGYQVIEELSNNASTGCKAYKVARDGQPYFLKLIINGNGREALLAEAKSLLRLRHPRLPSIVTIAETTEIFGSTAASHLYFVAQWIDGVPLQSIARPASAAAANQLVVKILVDVGSALCALHSAGLVHRDVSPQNILVDQIGGLSLVDVGLATPRVANATVPAGTLAAMAPEALMGTVDVRSDIYSLAVSTVYAVLGRFHWPSMNQASHNGSHAHSALIAEMMAGCDIASLPLAPQLRSLLQRMIALDPSHRPASAVDMLRQLQPIAALLSLPSFDIPQLSSVSAIDIATWRRPGLTDTLVQRLSAPAHVFIVAGPRQAALADIATAALMRVALDSARAGISCQPAMAVVPPPSASVLQVVQQIANCQTIQVIDLQGRPDQDSLILALQQHVPTHHIILLAQQAPIVEVPHVLLQPLHNEDIAALAHTIAGVELTPPQAIALHHASQGWALAAYELLIACHGDITALADHTSDSAVAQAKDGFAHCNEEVSCILHIISCYDQPVSWQDLAHSNQRSVSWLAQSLPATAIVADRQGVTLQPGWHAAVRASVDSAQLQRWTPALARAFELAQLRGVTLPSQACLWLAIDSRHSSHTQGVTLAEQLVQNGHNCAAIELTQRLRALSLIDERLAARSHIVAAKAAIAQGDFDGAWLFAQKAKSLQPLAAGICHASIHQRKGQLTEAFDILQILQQQFPHDHATAAMASKVALSMGDTKAALGLCQAAAADDPACAESVVLCHLYAGDHVAAELACSELQAQAIQNDSLALQARVHYLRGMIAQQRGQLLAAQDHYEQAALRARRCGRV
jgi:serine/threonine protein kinase/tetratricopeptide (TPR) repeat protein